MFVSDEYVCSKYEVAQTVIPLKSTVSFLCRKKNKFINEHVI